MTRTHDRTLLSRLGFQDPDRKNSRHDLACQFLSQGDHMLRALSSISPACTVYDAEFSLEHPITKGVDQYRTHIGFADVVAGFSIRRDFICFDETGESAQPCGIVLDGYTKPHVIAEVKITTEPIGDVLRQMRLYSTYWPRKTVRERVRMESGGWEWPNSMSDDEHRKRWARWRLLNGASHEEACADMEKLCNVSLVFFDWQISKAEAELLRSHQIYPFRLGKQFEAYVETSGAVAGDVLEL